MFITFKQTNALWISTRAMYNYKRIRILILLCVLHLHFAHVAILNRIFSGPFGWARIFRALPELSEKLRFGYFVRSIVFWVFYIKFTEELFK